MFSELYWCEESSFYKSPELKDIVYNEVNAALSMMQPDGRLSLAEHLPLVYDSNYGGYTSNILYAICQLWNNEDWIESLKKIGMWLYTAFPKEHPWNVKEDYPNYRADRFYVGNLTGRIPAFYACGVSSESACDWSEFIKSKFPEDCFNLEIIGISVKSLPPSFYLRNADDAKFYTLIPPSIIVDQEVRIISRHVGAIYLNGVRMDMEDGSFFANFCSGVNKIRIYVDDTFFFEKDIIVKQAGNIKIRIIDDKHSLF